MSRYHAVKLSPSSDCPLQSLSRSSQTSADGPCFCTQSRTPWVQYFTPSPHTPWSPVSHVTSPPGFPSSTSPSQSLSRLSHCSADADWFCVHTTLPPVHAVVPVAQTPSNSVSHVVPPPGLPSSATPSQLSSIPLHCSGAPGNVVDVKSSQSTSST